MDLFVLDATEAMLERAPRVDAGAFSDAASYDQRRRQEIDSFWQRQQGGNRAADGDPRGGRGFGPGPLPPAPLHPSRPPLAEDPTHALRLLVRLAARRRGRHRGLRRARALLRVSGKRTLAKLNAFDLVVTVALGSTLATVLLSQSVALADGLLGFALLVGAAIRRRLALGALPPPSARW